MTFKCQFIVNRFFEVSSLIQKMPFGSIREMIHYSIGGGVFHVLIMTGLQSSKRSEPSDVSTDSHT